MTESHKSQCDCPETYRGLLAAAQACGYHQNPSIQVCLCFCHHIAPETGSGDNTGPSETRNHVSDRKKGQDGTAKGKK